MSQPPQNQTILGHAPPPEVLAAQAAAKQEQAAAAAADTAGHAGHGDGHGHGEYPFLAHHFDTPEHQFDSGKLGIWLFLTTEILFFGGLFCAYAIYRSLHPEVFEYAHYYLDTTWGAVNTCVLIISSLTAAWAVRNAQLGQQKALVINIIVTILCAFAFMGVKYVEYSHKFHEGTLWASQFKPEHEAWELESYQAKHGPGVPHGEHAAAEGSAAPAPVAAPSAAAVPAEHAAPVGAPAVAAHKLGHGEFNQRPAHVGRFFSIYFCMTGLHGIHVLGGIIVWLWLLARALKGEFGPKYFGPIDYAALYWHLVDLIWIYLFPLLYLIH
jgi:cytochrome c oxidase subunit 3